MSRYRELTVTSLFALSSGFFLAYHVVPLPLIGVNVLMWRHPNTENVSYPTTYNFGDQAY